MVDQLPRAGGFAVEVLLVVEARQFARHLRDTVGFVADSLEVCARLHHRDEKAQVGGGRLAARDDVNALLIERHFEAVHFVIAGRHLGSAVQRRR